MELSSTPEGTGMTEAQAAERFAAMLDRDDPVQSEDGETEGEGAPQPDEPEQPSQEDPEEQEADDPDENPAEQSEEPPTYTVKIDGEEVAVTLDEALKGYQREADYTRKTQALAEKGKTLEAEQAAFHADRARTVELLGILEQSLQGQQASNDDLESLRYADPAEYAARIAENMQRQRAIEDAAAERRRLEALTAQETEKQRADRAVEEQGKLLQALPAWAEPAKAKAGFDRLNAYAKGLGFTDEDLNGLDDHRFFVVLNDAAELQALKSRTPQVKAKVEAVKTAKPGAARPPVTDTTRMKQRLAKTGSVDDAAAVFLSRMG